MTLFSTDQREWADLARYLSGELSDAEAARLEQACAADPGRADRLAKARQVWEAAGRPSGDWNAAAALVRIKAPVDRGAVAVPRFRFEPEPGRFRGLLAAAAAILLVVGAGLFARRAVMTTASPDEPPMAELTTLPGQRADLLLPDGSRVSLGMASRLRYPARYAGRSRDLYLDGEAYFQVVHDSLRPFRVHTRHGVTEDIGTAFDVRAYGSSPLQVVVTEGAAVLRATTDDGGASTDSLLLGPADLGRVDADGRLSSTRGVDVESFLAWRDDRLVFRNTPLAEVLDRLRAWYGLEIELADSSLAELPFTATFVGDPPEAVLKLLAITPGVRYEQRGALTMVYRKTP